MVQGNSLEQVQVVVGECIPLESLQVHVVAEVNTKVCACGYGPASMLEFFLVNVNGDICAHEMFQATGVVKMQMAKNNGLDVFDVIAGRLDSGWQALRVFILDTRKHIG